FVEAAADWKEEPCPRRRKQKDDLVGVVVNTRGVELWRDASGATYATVPIKDHLEHWPLKSEGFKRWLALVNYQKTGSTFGSQGIEDVVRTLDIKAYSEGRHNDPFFRVGLQGGNLTLYPASH